MNQPYPEINLIAALIPLLPLLGFTLNGLGFRKLPKGVAAFIGITTVVTAFAASLYLFSYFVGERQSQPFTVTLFNWIATPGFNISFSFLVDQLSLIMLLLVTGVGSLIHIYSAGYMHHDEGYGKFFAFLNLFVFSMLLLVLGSNYVVMFIGWEGVGLCSYLLIGFWNTNVNYANAAQKAFVMNRIGDLGFLLGIFLILNQFGTVEYSALNPLLAHGFEPGDATIFAICALLFVGAMGKSAQIPLYTWLPDAMAGPTPVSALIHAATMVTAGIYMVIRSNALYSLAPGVLEIIAVIGLVTAVFAATIGVLQNDIKKVLAYSTVSQLGYMFLGLGVGAYSSSMFHVLTHAFFKALLFLGAGSVIHAMSDEQDIRKMGGLAGKLKITFITFLIGTIAISGIPPFAGFFSKDEILAHVYQHSVVMYGFGVFASMLTSFYMFRLLFLTFFGEFRGTHEQEHHLHESPASMTVPLMVLAVLAAIGGFMNLPEVFSEHSYLAQFMAPLFAGHGAAHHEISHELEFTLMGISTAAAVIALIAAYVMYMVQKARPVADGESRGALGNLVYNKYYVDEIYDTAIVKPLFALSDFFYKAIEFLVIDLIVNGIGRLVNGLSAVFRKAQTGSITFYIFAMVAGVIAILAYNLCMALQ